MRLPLLTLALMGSQLVMAMPANTNNDDSSSSHSSHRLDSPASLSNRGGEEDAPDHFGAAMALAAAMEEAQEQNEQPMPPPPLFADNDLPAQPPRANARPSTSNDEFFPDDAYSVDQSSRRGIRRRRGGVPNVVYPPARFQFFDNDEEDDVNYYNPFNPDVHRNTDQGPIPRDDELPRRQAIRPRLSMHGDRYPRTPRSTDDGEIDNADDQFQLLPFPRGQVNQRYQGMSVSPNGPAQPSFAIPGSDADDHQDNDAESSDNEQNPQLPPAAAAAANPNSFASPDRQFSLNDPNRVAPGAPVTERRLGGRGSAPRRNLEGIRRSLLASLDASAAETSLPLPYTITRSGYVRGPSRLRNEASAVSEELRLQMERQGLDSKRDEFMGLGRRRDFEDDDGEDRGDGLAA